MFTMKRRNLLMDEYVLPDADGYVFRLASYNMLDMSIGHITCVLFRAELGMHVFRTMTYALAAAISYNSNV